MKMNNIYLCIALVLLPLCTLAQKDLYKSKSFTLSADRVKQDNYEAVARSRTEIFSNYRSPLKPLHSRLVSFKFSINGLDNEMAPGVNHSIILHPANGKVVAPVIAFGFHDEANHEQLRKGDALEPNTQVTFRLDLRHVFEAFRQEGYYTFFNGARITREEFKAVYIAGATEPLTWNFGNLAKSDRFELKDPDKDGIYEITLTFNVPEPEKDLSWTLKEDISGFPQFQSEQLIVDASYNKSLEELQQNVSYNGIWMASLKLPMAWTRHISYSTLLSLAAVDPQMAKKSLVARINNDRVIIQDAGTGGAYPVSTDRVSWALGAWEVYKVTGDKEWLKTAFEIIKNTLEVDQKTILDHEKHLFYGESTYLDWREQTYPAWMEPVDIFKSQSLGTNAVFFRTYQVMAQMAAALGQPSNHYTQTAEKIRQAINTHLWQADKGFYGQYLYGREHPVLSPRAETLGESLCVLFGIADENQQRSIIEKNPVLAFGAPVIYPQTPEVSSYHNDAILPFINAYRTWAAAGVKNSAAVLHGLASIYRPALLFVGNRENMMADNGDMRGTEINSERHLLSIAGNLAMVYRVLLGMSFEQDKLIFKPFIPETFTGTKTLRNFVYRNAKLTITVKGTGSTVKAVKLDGKKIASAEIPASLSGEHSLELVMGNEKPTGSISLVENYYAPATPKLTTQQDLLQWTKVEGQTTYQVFRNGKKVSETAETSYKPASAESYAEYQVAAVDRKGVLSFLGEPVRFVSSERSIYVQAEEFGINADEKFKNFSGYAYVPLDLNTNTNIRFKVKVEKAGKYIVDFRYANGSGEINLDDKAAIRTLIVNERETGVVVMPQRGYNDWSNWGFSNRLLVDLPAGEHTIKLSYQPHNKNMYGIENTALLDYIRLVRINEQ